MQQDTDQRWRDECGKQDSKNQEQPKATLPHRTAAVDSVRVDLIKRLRDQRQQGAQQHVSDPSTSRLDDVQLGPSITPHDAEQSRKRDAQPPAEGTESPSDSAGDPEFDPTATDALAAAVSEAEQVEALGTMLGHVVNHGENDIGRLRPETRQAMADHFWCELLVQLVVVVEESNRLFDSVPDKIANEITKSRRESKLAMIPPEVIAACTKQVWKRLTNVLGLTVISDAEALLPAVRILAILMCKSPPRHPPVVEHCVDPLETFLIQETKERLHRVFGELVPQISLDIAGGGPDA